MAYFRNIYFLVGATTLIYSPYTQADPLWELGLGLAGVSAPLYRGSNQSQTFLVPIPYFVYRGEKLKVGDGVIRGQLFDSEAIKIDFSAAANLPVPGHANSRVGMPDLAPTVEIGPSLELDLDSRTDNSSGWSLKFPLRLALSLKDFGRHGATFTPYVDYKSHYQGWQFAASAGPLFATQTYHDFYYEVLPQYVIPGRIEYHPAAGYSGSRLTFTQRRRLDNVWFGSFIRIDSLHGAQFGDSPLLQQRYAVIVGFGVSWIMARSMTQAPTNHP